MPDQNLIAPLEQTLGALREERTQAQIKYNETKETLEAAEEEVQRLKNELEQAKIELDGSLARLKALTDHVDKLRQT